MGYTWPLAVSTFSLWDRLKICSFFLNSNNRWTQGKYVRQLEWEAAYYVGVKHCVLVSSGSSANQLIAQQVKDRLVTSGEWPKRNKVYFGAVTWQTNVSVWVREGFEPIFLDVNMEDFSVDYSSLESWLKLNHDEVAAVFPTTVLGYTCNVEKLLNLEKQYPKVKFALDACENFFGRTDYGNICSNFTSSTSGFVAHHINSGSELGFIFTNNQEEYEYFLLARAHGLRRNLQNYSITIYNEKINEHYTNNLVDPQFDFQVLSSNYRSTDIAAFLCLLDAKKWTYNKLKRKDLYSIFRKNLNEDRFYLPQDRDGIEDVAFCLPLIIQDNNKKLYDKVRRYLTDNGIEQRSFVSGNMLRQKPYQQYGDYKDLKNAEYLNNFAIYIGLHTKVKEKQIIKLCKDLNAL